MSTTIYDIRDLTITRFGVRKKRETYFQVIVQRDSTTLTIDEMKGVVEAIQKAIQAEEMK